MAFRAFDCGKLWQRFLSGCGVHSPDVWHRLSLPEQIGLGYVANQWPLVDLDLYVPDDLTLTGNGAWVFTLDPSKTYLVYGAYFEVISGTADMNGLRIRSPNGDNHVFEEAFSATTSHWWTPNVAPWPLPGNWGLGASITGFSTAATLRMTLYGLEASI